MLATTIIIFTGSIYSLIFYHLNNSIHHEIIHSQQALLDSSTIAFNTILKQIQDCLLEITIDKTLQNELYNTYYQDTQPENPSFTLPKLTSCPMISRLLVNPYHHSSPQISTQSSSAIFSIFRYNSRTYLRIYQPITGMRDWKYKLGTLIADIDFDTFIAQLKFNSSIKENAIILLDDAHNIIYPYTLSSQIDSNTILETVQQGQYTSSSINLLSKALPIPGWTLITCFNMDDITNSRLKIKNTLIILGIIVLFICLLITLIISYQNTAPVLKLIEHMNKNELMTPIPIPSHIPNDILVLYQNYNTMLNKTNDLVNDIYHLTKQEKEIELKMLQAQINPHFLYNVLDSINWMAFKHHAADISLMVTSLAQMLRNSLNAGKTVLSIEQELSIVYNYLSLQEYRYNNSFSILYDIDHSILNKKVIRLILQPLVENAIIHGIEPSNERCCIIIGAQKKENDIILTVKNNGVMPNPIKLERILSGQDVVTNSYGIKNINMRIHNTFGDPYGLSYQIDGYWCTAQILIPSCDSI